jgi:hypothetical protein
VAKVAKARPTEAVGDQAQAEVVRRRRANRNFPASPFEEALAFAQQIFSFSSGQPVRRLSLFNHLEKSPESGPSRQLIINASRYGLIKGGYQAEILELTADGSRCVDPDISAREQARAKIKLAIEDVEPFKLLFERLVSKTLPAKAALVDAMKEFAVQSEAAEEAVDTFIVNLRFVGLLQTLSGAERIVSIDHFLDSLPASTQAKRATETREPTHGHHLVTAEHAHFESTCFYITPIGSEAARSGGIPTYFWARLLNLLWRHSSSVLSVLTPSTNRV